MDYYSRKIHIPKVDKNDKILGSIERWEAHEKGILHRAFTVGLIIKGKLLLQHRRHPVFDGVFDLTCSSHPTMEANKVQNTTEAVLETLAREWGVSSSKIINLTHKGSILYSAVDKQSIYREHEVCHLYIGEVKQLPKINYEFSYGYSLVSIDRLSDKKFPLVNTFAPWVPRLLPLL